MNRARLVKDSKNNIYLKVSGKPLHESVYFKIDLFATVPNKKIKDLTKQEMVVNLRGEE